MIKKFFSVEFSRFHNYYKKSRDLNAENDRESDSGRDGSTRYFINVGEKDGFDWMTLKDFLKEVLELEGDSLSRVDVKESFSFFNTNTEHQERVLQVFEDFKMEGRKVNVEISKDSGRRGGGRRRRDNDSGGGFKGKRRSDGFKPKGKKRFDSKEDRGSGGNRDRRKRSDRR